MNEHHWLFEVRTMRVTDATPDWELIGLDKECGLGTYVRNRLIATSDLDTVVLSFMIHVEKRESDQPESDAFVIPAISGHTVLHFLHNLHDHYMGLLATGLLDVSPIVLPEPPIELMKAPETDTAIDDLDRAMNEMYRDYKRKQNESDSCR